MRHARSLATALLVGGICFNVLLYWPSSPVQVDRSDVGRAEVARCFVARSLRSWHDFFGGQGYDRVSDRCADEVFLPGYTTGIPHAHNAFLQVLADQGVVAVLMMLVRRQDKRSVLKMVSSQIVFLGPLMMTHVIQLMRTVMELLMRSIFHLM